MGRALKGAVGLPWPILQPKSCLEEAWGGRKGELMDPGGASSLWGNENKCPQQVFTKGDPVPWVPEKFAARALLGLQFASNAALSRACIHSPLWKPQSCPFLGCTPRLSNWGWGWGWERMTPTSRACLPH